MPGCPDRSVTTTYTYDATGVRDTKTVGGVTYKLHTANGQVGRQFGKNRCSCEHTLYNYNCKAQNFSGSVPCFESKLIP